jgi:hypothetical protein
MRKQAKNGAKPHGKPVSPGRLQDFFLTGEDVTGDDPYRYTKILPQKVTGRRVYYRTNRIGRQETPRPLNCAHD